MLPHNSFDVSLTTKVLNALFKQHLLGIPLKFKFKKVSGSTERFLNKLCTVLYVSMFIPNDQSKD